MPSNRPQTINGPGPAASSLTRDWVNGRPRGLIKRRGRSWEASAASIAAASTSARSTMPGPPPAGVSSTLRCRSVAESLMSRASSVHSPDASALPARLTPSGPGNISGNTVSTVPRQIFPLEVIAFQCRLPHEPPQHLPPPPPPPPPHFTPHHPPPPPSRLA